MHARTAARRRAWFAGSIVASAGAASIAPALGAAVAGIATVVIVGSALRPSSDFYLRSIRRNPRQPAGVALTFDDGPDPVRSPQILDALAEVDAPATFFMIGRRASLSPRLVERAAREGHEVAAHSHSHSRLLPFRGRRRHVDEILACTQALLDAGAPAPRWYRAPMGYATPPLAEALREQGLQSVHWSIGSRDLALRDKASIIARVLPRVRGGDIVLMHDGADRRGPGPEAVPAVIRTLVPELRRRGFEPMTLCRLLTPSCEGSRAEA